MTVLGIDPYVGTPETATRIGTRSAFDLAYWASTFLAPGTPDDYIDIGPETDGVSLLAYAAGQVGVDIPTELADVRSLIEPNAISVQEALRYRGAVLICQQRVSIAMGLGDVIDVVKGRYFQYKPTVSPQNPATCIFTWDFGALLPGVLYK